MSRRRVKERDSGELRCLYFPRSGADAVCPCPCCGSVFHTALPGVDAAVDYERAVFHTVPAPGAEVGVCK